MTNDASVHLTKDEANAFLHNLMYPSDETIEARRKFLSNPSELNCTAIEEALHKREDS